MNQTIKHEAEPKHLISFSSDLRERIFNNFILDIAVYLNKKEKLCLRGTSINFNESILCLLPINFNLKGKKEDFDFNDKNLKLEKILRNFKNVLSLNIENIKINEEFLKLFEMIIHNNKTKIKKISIGNIFYESNESIAKFFDILNNIQGSIDNFVLINAGNRDRLFVHLEVNKKKLKFANKIRKLKIDNIFPKQIPFIIKSFPIVDDLTIENCSIGEELNVIANEILSSYKENQLKLLNLSCIGLSSDEMIDRIKHVITTQRFNKNLVMKGLWLKSLSGLKSELNTMKQLCEVDFTGSKYAFNSPSSFDIFNSFLYLKRINLSDCRIRDTDLELLLKNLSEETSNTLEDLILYGNLIYNDSMNIINFYESKLKSLKTLNLSFNKKITDKGFNYFLEMILCGKLKNLKFIDLKNCGLVMKHSFDKLKKFIFTKPDNLECIDICFTSLSNDDYINFVKQIYEEGIKKISNSDSDNKINLFHPINLKLFLKLNNLSNQKLFIQTKMYTDILYVNHNLIIR